MAGWYWKTVTEIAGAGGHGLIKGLALGAGLHIDGARRGAPAREWTKLLRRCRPQACRHIGGLHGNRRPIQTYLWIRRRAGGRVQVGLPVPPKGGAPAMGATSKLMGVGEVAVNPARSVQAALERGGVIGRQ